MASLEYDRVAEQFRVRFRFEGREYKRSLKTDDRKAARGLMGRIEYTLQLIERGELSIPVDADPAKFIVTAGKRTGEEAKKPRSLTLKELFETYEAKLPSGSKEASTLYGEKIHFKHLLKYLKASTRAQSLSVSAIQDYVEQRSADKWRGKLIRPDTIKKELTTLRLVWNWAVRQGLLTGPSPVRGVTYSRRDEKTPFMTRTEIERVVARGGLSTEEEGSIWQSLYLTREEVAEVLDHVKAAAKEPFVYPLFVFVAHTGARRSEIIRARIDDFDFESETILIREKKKSKSKAITYRRVAMTSLLKTVMQDWFTRHPGGQAAIARMIGKDPSPLTRDQAHDYFKAALTDGKWSCIRGFHVFRHSFASNLAAASVDQRIIDEFLGHTTEEMRRRYRHLFPDVRKSAIAVLEDCGK